MFRLAKPGSPQLRYIDFKDHVDLCELCMCGTESRRQWIAKGNKSGPIRKYIDNNPRYGVSVYQLQSDHTGLAPQLSGKITSARICDAQEMVEHFSYLTYIHLIISTKQEDTLSVKSAFEI